eukprot:jgi/Ulvmu1/8635/UM046_0038.1
MIAPLPLALPTYACMGMNLPCGLIPPGQDCQATVARKTQGVHAVHVHGHGNSRQLHTDSERPRSTTQVAQHAALWLELPQHMTHANDSAWVRRSGIPTSTSPAANHVSASILGAQPRRSSAPRHPAL